MSDLQLTPIRIDSKEIGATDFCAALKHRSLEEYQQLVDRVADYHLVRDAASRHGLTASTAEVQIEADEWRRTANLLSKEDTENWLDYKNLAVDDLEQHAEFRVLAKKVLEKEYGAGAVRKWFEDNQDRYTMAALSVIAVDSEDKAKALSGELKKDPYQFARLARQHSVEPRTAMAGGMLGWVTVDEVPAEARAAVLNSNGDDEIIGPVQSTGGWDLIQVAAIEKPALAGAMERIAMSDLLADWLAAERKRVQVSYRRAG